MKNIIKYGLITFALFIVFPIIFLAIKSPGTTEPYSNENSITEIEINSTSLFTVIRGKNKDNPILLMLHGGPGTTELPMMRYFNHTLEEDFTVVYYDQRGASSSFHEQDTSGLTLEVMIHDTHLLTKYLKERFHKNKIFLMGHSWGSYLGLHTVHQYPEDYYAYIGTGQISNQLESEKRGYFYALSEAKKFNDSTTVKELKALGQINTIEKNKIIPWVISQRQYIDKYHGSMYQKSAFDIMVLPILESEELTLSQKFGTMNGTFSSLEQLFPNVLEDNLIENKIDFQVPIYFLQGKHDYVTSYVLAQKYFDKINAPSKKFITFDKSAHSPNFEEPEKFNHIVKILFKDLE